MEYQIIDDFLDYQDLKKIQDLIVFSQKIPFYLNSIVSAYGKSDKEYDPNVEEQLWNWYGTHLLYTHDKPQSSSWELIYNIFLPKLNKVEEVKSFMRAKINFYPNTGEIKEHGKHVDYYFSHKAGVYSLNTCDGFTRMPNGDIVESVENRMVLFDASQHHNSSTTTNAKGRFNINFNWL